MALLDCYTKEELEEIIKNSSSIKDALRKLGFATTSGSNNKTLKKKIEEYNIDTSHFAFKKGIERTPENIFIENSTATQAILRRYYIKGNYSTYECSICHRPPTWEGKPLTLILDHINGINNDDRLENLRWVCPNCNQQLETTGHKKMRIKKNKKIHTCPNCGKTISKNSLKCTICANKDKIQNPPITKEELEELIKTMSFLQISKKFKVSDNTIRKWCKKYNLPYKKEDIKKYFNNL